LPAIGPRRIVEPLANIAPDVAAAEATASVPKPVRASSVALNDASPLPVIRVTIGRIEVRAVFPPAATPPTPARKPPAGTLSLEEYLKQRSEGKR
jgi:hypothetical protein